MSRRVEAVDAGSMYPHRTLDEEARRNPEAVLRWAGTWLNGDAACHGVLLRSAADAAAQRDAAVARLIAADVAYDAALAEKARIHAAWKLAHDVATASDDDFLPLHAADDRVQAALARRRAALVAIQGGAA